MLRAFHVGRGGRAVAEEIDAWLAARAAEVVRAADAYAACVQMLGHAEWTPDWVFVDVTGLYGEERSLPELLRRTWPGAEILLYGTGVDDLPPVGGPTHYCANSAAVQRALNEPPIHAPAPAVEPTRACAVGEDRLATIAESPAGRVFTSGLRLVISPHPPASTGLGVRGTQPEQVESARREPTPNPVELELADGSGRPPADEPEALDPRRPPRTFLTREEFAALMEDIEL